MTRLLRRSSLSFLLFICVWLCGLLWFILQIPLKPEDEMKPLDAIVVLTGGAGRFEHGLELLAGHKGKALFISGVSKKTTLADLLYYSPPELRVKVKGMPIVLGHEAENTIGNARETSTWLHQNGYNAIYLVTSNYHMPRSLVEMEEVAPDLTLVPAPVFPDDFSVHRWWASKYSRTLILLEYHKFLASKFRHWFVSQFRSAHKPAAQNTPG